MKPRNATEKKLGGEKSASALSSVRRFGDSLHRETVVDLVAAGAEADPDEGEEETHADVHAESNAVGEKVSGVVFEIALRCRRDGTR